MIPESEKDWLRNTQGLVEDEEGDWLSQLAARVPRELAIVEVGSHTGLSTCWMAGGAMYGNGAHVIAIDPWPPPRPNSEDDPWDLGPEGVLQRFKDNVAGITQDVPRTDYGSHVTALRLPSEEASRIFVKDIGMLFIDAIHEEWAVLADWAAWKSHVVRGGTVAFHDYGESYPGCKRAIDTIHRSNEVSHLGIIGSLWVGFKR